MILPVPEFSRIVLAETLDEGGSSLDIEADEGERSLLAERFGLAGLDSLTAALRLTPQEGRPMVRLEGAFRAEIVQTCVVSHEPIEATLEGSLERLYDTAPEPADQKNDGNFDIDAADPPKRPRRGKLTSARRWPNNWRLKSTRFRATPNFHSPTIRQIPTTVKKSNPGVVLSPPWPSLERN